MPLLVALFGDMVALNCRVLPMVNSVTDLSSMVTPVTGTKLADGVAECSVDAVPSPLAFDAVTMKNTSVSFPNPVMV